MLISPAYCVARRPEEAHEGERLAKEKRQYSSQGSRTLT
jgi:hypothetical protein